MTRTHRISLAEFDALAGGGGRMAGVLQSSQASRRLLLLRTVVDTASRKRPVEYVESGIEDSYTLLAGWHRASGTTVAEVLTHPQVGAWGMWCLRRLRGATGGPERAPRSAGATGEAPLVVDLSHLACIAAAAAVRSGVDFEIRVPVRDGLVQLPTLGAAVVGQACSWCMVRGRRGAISVDVNGEAAGASVIVGAAEDPRWLPVRRLRSVSEGRYFDVVLEDVDPFRGFGDLIAQPRLDEAAVQLWQQRLDDAWRLLVRHHRHRVDVIADGVASLVPLRAPHGNQELSATSGDAFGAVALTTPRDGLTLAVSLVHEAQHGKLSALLHLVPLVAGPSDARHYAPWRSDPRPVANLLQGCYAYLGITDFWYVHRSSAGGADGDGDQTGRQADFELARWRQAVSEALDTVTGAGTLTDPGARFVAGMRASLRPLLDASVPAWIEALADDVAAGHRAGWAIRNLHPDTEQVERAAHAWVRGGSCPWRVPPQHTVVAGQRGVADIRMDLAYARLKEPDRFAELAPTPDRLVDGMQGATASDVFLVAGDYAVAAEGYTAEITRQRHRGRAWAGLAVAARRLGDMSSELLWAHPHVVSALFQAVRQLGASPPDPRILSRWVVESDSEAANAESAQQAAEQRVPGS